MSAATSAISSRIQGFSCRLPIWCPAGIASASTRTVPSPEGSILNKWWTSRSMRRSRLPRWRSIVRRTVRQSGERSRWPGGPWIAGPPRARASMPYMSTHSQSSRTDWARPSSWGAATLGLDRPDVGAIFAAGSRPADSRCVCRASRVGAYRIIAYAHSTIAGTFNQFSSADVVVTRPVSNPIMALDAPITGTLQSSGFVVGGWAVDLGAVERTRH